MSTKSLFGICLISLALGVDAQELNQPKFEVQTIFDSPRLPNIICAMDGSLLAVWGWDTVVVRRSVDGGEIWESPIFIGQGIHGGGALVDEVTGDILVFSEDRHPPAPQHMFRSIDHGKTWTEEKMIIYPDSRGNVPSFSMAEKGISLTKGKYAGRLIRPARVYAGGNDPKFWDGHYNSAIYSDDRGKTWKSSEPFPVLGTGEGAIVELSDGTIYYNSRRHKSTDGRSPRWRYIAVSKDGGETWVEERISDVLPDGNQRSDYGLMGGLEILNQDGKDILLFSNIDIPMKETTNDLPFENRWGDRFRGTLWVSMDGGENWPIKKLVEEGSFAYSSIVKGREGTLSEGWIYLLYESGRGGKIARFNWDWIFK